MIKGLEKRLKSCDSSVQRREGSEEVLINRYKYVMGGCKEDGGRLFPVVSSYKTMSNGHKLEHRKLCLNIRKHFTVQLTEHWHRFPREVVESPSMETLKNQLDQGN